jgi:hypothetical protein
MAARPLPQPGTEVYSFPPALQHYVEAKLPDFRINCGVFGRVTVGQSSIDGICTGQGNLFNRIAMGYEGAELTNDSDAARANTRRTYACGSGSACNFQNHVLGRATGFYTSYTSCDEFPFALRGLFSFHAMKLIQHLHQAEEGGVYLGTLPQNLTHVKTTCTLVWQQNIQASCNRIVGTLSTNVGRTTTADWRSWTDAG